MNSELKSVKQLTRVIIKFSNKKDEQVMLFDKPVNIYMDLLTNRVGLYDEEKKCLFTAHWNIVDYCQVATDIGIKPIIEWQEQLESENTHVILKKDECTKNFSQEEGMTDLNCIALYEHLNLTPKQLQEIDKLYLEKCKEVTELRKS